MINSTEIIKELNNCYKIINERLFNNKLSDIMITFYTDGKDNRTLGHFTKQKVWNNNIHELVIKGLQWNGKAYDILGTLIHEMVHFYCALNNIKDVESNGRHNKLFKENAEKFGLIVFKPINKNIGYTTNLKENVFQDLKTTGINIEILEKYKNNLIFPEKVKSNKISYKYMCLNCDIKFTLSKDLKLNCGECNTAFDITEKGKEDL